MKFWTIQSQEVLEIIEEKGVYYPNVYSALTATLARSNSRTTSEMPHVEKSDIIVMAYQNYGMTKEYQEVIK